VEEAFILHSVNSTPDSPARDTARVAKALDEKNGQVHNRTRWERENPRFVVGPNRMKAACARVRRQSATPAFPMYLEFYRPQSSSHRGGRGRDLLRGVDVMIKRARGASELRALANEWKLLHELATGFFAEPVEFRLLPDGSAYLTTRWLSGTSFESFCVTADEGQLATVVRKALDGLAILHRAGFVHGDVRPQNLIVVSAPGTIDVQWMDLEHAAPFSDPVARRSYVAGWNAPSLERGQGQSPSTDLHAFGLVVAHILEKRRRSGYGSVALLGDFASALLHQNPLDPISDAVEAGTHLDRMLETHLCGPVPGRPPTSAWHVVNRRAQAAWKTNWPQWSRSGRQTLVAVYGPEGCGKSTFLRAAAAELALDGFQVLNLIDWDADEERQADAAAWGTRLENFIRAQSPDPTLLIADSAVWEEQYPLYKHNLIAPLVVVIEGREPHLAGAPEGWNSHEWQFMPFSDREWYEWVIAST
jgi:hypothetical protein